MSAYRTAEPPREALVSEHHAEDRSLRWFACGVLCVVLAGMAALGGSSRYVVPVAVGAVFLVVVGALTAQGQAIRHLAIYERTLRVTTGEGTREIRWEDVTGLRSWVHLSTTTVNGQIVSSVDRHVLELRGADSVTLDCELQDNARFLSELRARVAEVLAEPIHAEVTAGRIVTLGSMRFVPTGMVIRSELTPWSELRATIEGDVLVAWTRTGDVRIDIESEPTAIVLPALIERLAR